MRVNQVRFRVEWNMHAAYVVPGVKPMQNHCRQQKGSEGKGRDRKEEDIHGSVQPLFAAAMLTRLKMLLVIPPQFRRHTGDVVPPPGENGPNYVVITGGVTGTAGLHRVSGHQINLLILLQPLRMQRLAPVPT